MKKISVLVVDDSPLIRKILTEILNAEHDIEVIGTAEDPLDAREKIKKLNPQVITLDIEMPKMDGISFLEKIMTLRPTPVIMISTLTQKGADETFRALEIGAIDFVSKPVSGDLTLALDDIKRELPEKIRAAAESNIARMAETRKEPAKSTISFKNMPPEDMPIIAIGSSTGGVEALRDLFQALPEGCPPIVITQHMRAQFLPMMAARLNSMSKVTVVEARPGDVLKPGYAYLAPGETHLKIARQGRNFICRLESGERVSGHLPSVDVMFESIADSAGAQAIGIILTGMGSDGAKGLLKMRQAGAYTIGQNKSSCVVYGMPKVAAEIGAVDIELPLNQIASHALEYCAQRKGKTNAG